MLEDVLHVCPLLSLHLPPPTPLSLGHAISLSFSKSCLQLQLHPRVGGQKGEGEWEESVEPVETDTHESDRSVSGKYEYHLNMLTPKGVYKTVQSY